MTSSASTPQDGQHVQCDSQPESINKPTRRCLHVRRLTSRMTAGPIQPRVPVARKRKATNPYATAPDVAEIAAFLKTTTERLLHDPPPVTIEWIRQAMCEEGPDRVSDLASIGCAVTESKSPEKRLKPQPSETEKRNKLDQRNKIDQNQLIQDIVCTILGSIGIPTPILDTDLRIFRKNRHVATIHLKSNQHTTSCWKSENGDWQEAACQRKLAFTVCPEAYGVPIPTLTRETLRAVTDVRAETPKRVFTSIGWQAVPMIDFRKTREKYGSGYVVYVISNQHWPYDEHGCQFERGYNARIDLSL